MNRFWQPISSLKDLINMHRMVCELWRYVESFTSYCKKTEILTFCHFSKDLVNMHPMVCELWRYVESFTSYCKKTEILTFCHFSKDLVNVHLMVFKFWKYVKWFTSYGKIPKISPYGPLLKTSAGPQKRDRCRVTSVKRCTYNWRLSEKYAFFATYFLKSTIALQTFNSWLKKGTL